MIGGRTVGIALIVTFPLLHLAVEPACDDRVTLVAAIPAPAKCAPAIAGYPCGGGVGRSVGMPKVCAASAVKEAVRDLIELPKRR
jgi:hypothetical protein